MLEGADGPRWQLNPLQQAERSEPIPVPSRGLTIGRDAKNDIVLSFPGASAYHARVFEENGQLVLEDVGSTNGTLVEGKPIQRRVMAHGESFEVGAAGPRFLVLSASKLDSTVLIPKDSLRTGRRRTLGSDTMRLVREELGIPQLRAKSRRQGIWLGVLFVVLAGAGTAAFLILQSRGRDQTARVTARMEEELRRAHEEVDGQRRAWLEQEEKLRLAEVAWSTHKADLEKECRILEQTIARLEADEKAAVEEIDRLRRQLDDTSHALERYNPLNLEQDKLAQVARVEGSVVLIEASQSFRETETGEPLYFTQGDEGEPYANFSGEGQLFTVEATGSGFCVSTEGWILTNAHVVHKKAAKQEFFVPGIPLETVTDLSVTFSGRSERHAATLVDWRSDSDQDLALLKIDPFEGMPFLEQFDTKLDPPLPGTEVFLLGFQLGKRVLHRGDIMLASTFKGIVSRSVDRYLQVDAAVHPGASGGPLIDGLGRVLGVVVGMQTVDEITGSSSIGYIIPVGQVSSIWPPSQTILQSANLNSPLREASGRSNEPTSQE